MNVARAKVFTTIAATLVTSVAGAQSLYSPGNVGIPVNSRGEPEPAASLIGYSMIVITPPPPREIQRHDLITIIVNQTSQSR
ncbi:MAG: hypothetical protein AAFO89_13165, partial [Planctomycetota bacterium]